MNKLRAHHSKNMMINISASVRRGKVGSLILLQFSRHHAGHQRTALGASRESQSVG